VLVARLPAAVLSLKWSLAFNHLVQKKQPLEKFSGCFLLGLHSILQIGEGQKQ
jgi:hypothetical protein